MSLGCQTSQECLWSRNWFLWPQAPQKSFRAMTCWAAGIAPGWGCPGGRWLRTHPQVRPPGSRHCIEDQPQLLASPSEHLWLCGLSMWLFIFAQKLKSQKWLKGGTWIHYFKIYEPGCSESISSTSLFFSWISDGVSNGKILGEAKLASRTSYFKVLRNL